MSPRMAWRTGQRFDPETEARWVVPGTKLPLYRVVLVCRRSAIGAFLVAVAAGVLLFTAPASTSGRAILGMLLFVAAVGVGMVATLVGSVAGVARGVVAARDAIAAEARRHQPQVAPATDSRG